MDAKNLKPDSAMRIQSVVYFSPKIYNPQSSLYSNNKKVESMETRNITAINYQKHMYSIYFSIQ